jgi:hypothetical protein
MNKWRMARNQGKGKHLDNIKHTTHILERFIDLKLKVELCVHSDSD